MPELYSKVRPEIRLIHETYFVKDPSELRRYVETEFCPANKIRLDELKLRLRLLECTIATIEVI